MVYVETSMKSWTDGYASWVAARPAVVLALEKGSGTQIMLHMPFLDYFAADGKSIYSSSSTSANIDFLRKLPQSAQKRSGSGGGELEPTLGEYLEMFPKLRPYKTPILARKHPVLLAICKYDTPACMQQNHAFMEFKGRAASLGIQVVEVKLFKNFPEE